MKMGWFIGVNFDLLLERLIGNALGNFIVDFEDIYLRRYVVE